jgi:hypothetical protein
MVKNYSKQSNSLSNTKKGGGIFETKGITYQDYNRVKPVGKTVDEMNQKLKTIKPEATLDDIQNLAILKDFNTAFIGYLRKKANDVNGDLKFKQLFDVEQGNVTSENKINDLKYSRLINNNPKLPTNNQIKTLKNNKNIKNKVCKNNQPHNGPVNPGVEGANNQGNGPVAVQGPAQGANNQGNGPVAVQGPAQGGGKKTTKKKKSTSTKKKSTSTSSKKKSTSTKKKSTSSSSKKKSTSTPTKKKSTSTSSKKKSTSTKKKSTKK